MKRNKKSIVIMVLCFMVLFVIFGATVAVAGPAENAVQAGGSFDDIENFGIKVLNVLMGIGGLIVVAGLIFTGINFSLSAANPEKKRLAYAGLIGCVVGGIILFGAFKWAGVLKGEAKKTGSVDTVKIVEVM